MTIARDILNAFASNYTVNRYGVGTYVNGEAVPGPITPLIIWATIQPLTDAEMLSLPEGRRTRRYVKCYTDTLLRIGDQVAGIGADQIFYDGSFFECERVETWIWTPPEINFWKAIMAQVNP
jgi:hypothetical protein